MLKSLAVTNFLCFGERTCLNLGTPPPSFALLVGKNATGKTSLLRALACVRNLALGGSRPGQPLPVKPHLGDSPGPVRIELTVWQDDALFAYGFAATAQRVEEEWLTRTPAGGSPHQLFKRTSRDASAQITVDFGEVTAEERKRLELVAYGTRPNQLFLNEGLRRGVRDFAPLGTWLRDRLQMIFSEAKIVGLAARVAREPAFGSFLEELLREVPSGVAKVEVRRDALGPDAFDSVEEERELVTALTRYPDAFAETEEGELIAEPHAGLVEVKRVRLAFMVDGCGHRTELPASELGDGLLRLLHLAPLIYRPKAQAEGSAAVPPPVFFLDDFARGLHPELLNRLLVRFLQTSGPGGQLIATAHDAAIVHDELLSPGRVYELRHGSRGSQLHPLPL